MHRRVFIKSVGVVAGTVGAGGFIAACAGDDGESAGGSDGAGQENGSGNGQGPADQEQATLNVLPASVPFEILAGENTRFAFALSTLEQEPVTDADVEVRVEQPDGTAVSGPFDAAFYPDAGPLGLYLTAIDVPEPGSYVVVVDEGEPTGQAAIEPIAPSDSALPTPGDEAVSVQTPTEEDDMGVEELCTLQPDPCGMHETSLDTVLSEGRPAVVLFATPAYCQTATCGPSVETLEALRTSGDYDDVAFVHVEIFSDAGQTIAEPVEAWSLPTEPWLFTIDANGDVVDRIDGAMVDDELREVVGELG